MKRLLLIFFVIAIFLEACGEKKEESIEVRAIEAAKTLICQDENYKDGTVDFNNPFLTEERELNGQKVLYFEFAFLSEDESEKVLAYAAFVDTDTLTCIRYELTQ